MEINKEKSKIIVKITNDSSADIAININKQAFPRIILVPLRSDAAAMARLSKLWTNILLSLSDMNGLYKPLVVSITMNGCETLALHVDTKRRIQAFEHRFLRIFIHRAQYYRSEQQQLLTHHQPSL
ncbi:hypothetical protein DPMN_143448 [Dreissena polymorpha]|uniref:Uncharacterized protein n=1 Tax=Dreissena polymorpha TaxID=45954 RepID=A0A9D4GD53_DREPO|nr:hypothetical protein DPMN_143448 [Dreissena polymorpha]